MKKILGVFFAFAMLLSVAFVGEMTSSNSPFSAQAQTEMQTTRRGNVTVRRKRTGGVVGGAKYVGTKTVKGTKCVGKKTVGGAKAVTSRTKKILLGN